MRSERFPWRVRGVSSVAVACALAWLLAGCGGPAALAYDPEDARIRRMLDADRCPKTTLTLKDLGETYSEEAWAIARQPSRPAYQKITEADAFGWEYLREIQGRRSEVLDAAERQKLEEMRRAQALEEKERRRKEKIERKAAARAARAEAIEKAEKPATAAAPPPEPPPAE